MRMTCQICGRGIMSKLGVIAHHGYERPHLQHYQTRSCFGARNAPWEVSRASLGDLIKLIKVQLGNQREYLAQVEAEMMPVIFRYTAYRSVGLFDRDTVTVQLTRATFEAEREKHRSAFLQHSLYDFDRAKSAHVKRCERDVANSAQALKDSKERYASWKQTHKFVAGEFVKV